MRPACFQHSSILVHYCGGEIGLGCDSQQKQRESGHFLATGDWLAECAVPSPLSHIVICNSWNLHELCRSPAHLLHHLPITSGVVAVHYLLTAIKAEPVAQFSRRNPSQLRQPHNQSKLPYCLIFGSLLSVACGWRCAPPPTTLPPYAVSQPVSMLPFVS